MKIVIAPSGFKESLTSVEAAHAIEAGFRRVFPDAHYVLVPMADGGEGFTETLVEATGGQIRQCQVSGPVGPMVDSHFGFLGDRGAPERASERGSGAPKTAILEMAAAAGLRLVPKDQRDPLNTSTRGVGELIGAALDEGAARILVGCGDSGTNDGGMGAAQALGVRFLDENGAELEGRGANLEKIARIDISGRDPRLEAVQLDVALNWHNVLCGPNGVARVFGPQKGASPETVERLEAALENYAAVIEREFEMDVREINGGGASGGLGAGFHALLGAKLHPRFDIIMAYLDLDSHLEGASLAISAEGAIDFQTPRGKVPVEVARRAQKFDVPTIVIAGTLGHDVGVNYQHGIAAFENMLSRPCTLEEAIEHADELLTDGAERAARFINVGHEMRF